MINQLTPKLRTPDLPEHERHVLEQALAAFQEATGLNTQILRLEPEVPNAARADTVIEIAFHGGAERFQVEIKQADRFATLGQIQQQLGRLPGLGLWVAPKIANDMADKCRELGLHFIDAQGNAYINTPCAFVFIKGQRRRGEGVGDLQKAPRAGTATALRVMFALLCEPALMNAPYREINQAAGVALGVIGGVFDDLNTRGYTTGGDKRGARRLLERKKLMDEWVTNYPIKLRPKLNPRRFRANDPDWWKQVDITHYEAQWGGEIAADKLTQYLKPATTTIYLHGQDKRKNLTRLVADNKLRAAPDGDIEVLDAFWHLPDTDAKDTVPPLLVYADLLEMLDPRADETVRMIHEQFLADA